MIYFRNDNEEYVSWLERYAEAFVLNTFIGGKHQARLHTSRCLHLYPPGPGLKHTEASPKACSRDRDELTRWAMETGFTVVPCIVCGT